MTTLSASAFAPSHLPDTLPIFPLSGAVLLPHAPLPLHIFEPRYLAMIDDALVTRARLIGMIQPCIDAAHNDTHSHSHDSDHDDDTPPAIYSVGCAGRISSFAEMDDGRFMISLTGLCRFEVGEELALPTPYRQVRPVWDRFLADMKEVADITLDTARLSAALKPYFKSQNIEADWSTIEAMSPETLVSTLTMVCPFAANEKQALLEAPDLAARADMLMTLLEMSSTPSGDGLARH